MQDILSKWESTELCYYKILIQNKTKPGKFLIFKFQFFKTEVKSIEQINYINTYIFGILRHEKTAETENTCFFWIR